MKLTLPNTPQRLGALLLALLAGLAGLALAWHYPLRHEFVTLAWLVLAALALCWWQVLPLLLPGFIPVLGLAPWTGWISFEEMDLLVLAAAAGGYAALALGASRNEGPRAPSWQRSLAWSGLAKLLLALFAASLALAVWRGLQDAGGWRFGWWQGYHEPMNSLRQGKSFFLVLLLLPLWRAAAALQPAAVQRWFGAAMVLALALASLAALWERLAFTGLLDFSSDYRTTALFWEMHVGGAALDGCLALSLPFALVWTLREQRPLPFVAALGLLLLAGYAALTTFSRGVYLALPLGAALSLLLLAWQRRGARAQHRVSAVRWQRRGVQLGLLLGFGLAAWPLFLGGGYRGMLALAGSALLLICLPRWRLEPTFGQRLIVLLLALMLATLVGLLGWALSLRVPKAAYALDALAVLGGLGLAWAWRAGIGRYLQACALAGAWFLSLACAAIVAGYWGGERGQQEALLPLVLLALAWSALQLLPGPVANLLPEQSWRAKSLLWTGCLLLAAMIGTFAGGAYIGDRMATGQRDLQGRLDHWRLGLSLLDGPADWLLGKGVGRFVESYFYAGPQADQIGDYRLHEEDGHPYLSLSGGRHLLGWGERFRVTQHMAVPHGALRLSVRARAKQDVNVQVEVCEKHLLYSSNCVSKFFSVKASAGGPADWQRQTLELGPSPATGGAWWAPRLITFAVALDTGAARVDLAELQLADARSTGLLANSDFSQGMAHWFSSSDRHHMPWHMKSLPLHMLFEQGLLGLGLGGALWVAALWRCSLGHGRRHALAPAVAGALLAFAIVGLFDSLIDAPRIGLLFFAVLLLGLGLRALPPPKA